MSGLTGAVPLTSSRTCSHHELQYRKKTTLILTKNMYHSVKLVTTVTNNILYLVKLVTMVFKKI